MQAREIMTRDVKTVRPDCLVKRAAEAMAEHGFAALPVVDEHDKLVGMVAEVDVLRDRFRRIRACTCAATMSRPDRCHPSSSMA